MYRRCASPYPQASAYVVCWATLQPLLALSLASGRGQYASGQLATVESHTASCRFTCSTDGDKTGCARGGAGRVHAVPRRVAVVAGLVQRLLAAPQEKQGSSPCSIRTEGGKPPCSIRGEGGKSPCNIPHPRTTAAAARRCRHHARHPHDTSRLFVPALCYGQRGVQNAGHSTGAVRSLLHRRTCSVAVVSSAATVALCVDVILMTH